ncbi:MAG: calcium/sodium antiporter [Planctomycetaceae bacterium]
MTTFLLLCAGLIALVAGAECLVRGAAKIASSWGISSLVIGLTVVAFGTSAPELAVSVASSAAGQADIALGNVVGSNNFNVLLILGLSALIVPLIVDQRLVRLDVPLMIAASIAVYLMGLDGLVSRAEGGCLFVGLLSYTLWCLKVARQESAAIVEEYREAFEGEEEVSDSVHKRNLWLDVGFVLVGLLLLVLGADWLVDGATRLARQMKISELVIGLTIVAGGTSLPELATSLVAAVRGERDIAVGNVVGSNLFNLLGVLGLSALISPTGVHVAEQAVRFDIPVMIAVSVACLPIFASGHRIARWEGALFVGYQIAYIATLVMLDTKSPALAIFSQQMWWFVLPLTAVTLLVMSWRTFVKR